jgi:hypothetical protein
MAPNLSGCFGKAKEVQNGVCNTTRKTAIGSIAIRSVLHMWCAVGIYP